MSTPESRTDMLRRVLAENGILEQAPDGLHSWRCEYPDRYGPCFCRDDLVADIETELDAREDSLRVLIERWRQRAGDMELVATDAQQWAGHCVHTVADELEQALQECRHEL